MQPLWILSLLKKGRDFVVGDILLNVSPVLLAKLMYFLIREYNRLV